METPTMGAYIQPSIYEAEAIDASRSGATDEISVNFCIIRLWLSLADDDLSTASACLHRLRTEKLGGWPLYQVTTASIFLAIKIGNNAHIIAAVDAWLTGLAAYPGNWTRGLLDAPEIVPWLIHFNPQRWAPTKPKKRRLTKAQRAFVGDPESTIKRAIAENMVWLRELGFADSEVVMACWYKLTSVHLGLREATFDASNTAPTLIVSFDEKGTFTGSFIAH
jgi:hypothetical protein